MVPNETELQELRLRLAAIEERNRRVESDKAWEVSTCRKISIVCLTYIVMCLLFWTLNNEYFLLNAIVPTIGFFLSTLSLPIIKSWWHNHR